MGQQQQIIGGQTYTMYTPQWYSARDADQVHQGDIAGQVAGTAQGAASKANWQTKYPGMQTPGPYDYQNVLSGLMNSYGSSSGSGGYTPVTGGGGGGGGGYSGGGGGGS